MTRPVTEADFRCEEFRDAKAEDYEFRLSDGKLIRKDRWEVGVRHIAALVNVNSDFEVSHITDAVESLSTTVDKLTKALSVSVATDIDALNLVEKCRKILLEN